MEKKEWVPPDYTLVVFAKNRHATTVGQLLDDELQANGFHVDRFAWRSSMQDLYEKIDGMARNGMQIAIIAGPVSETSIGDIDGNDIAHIIHTKAPDVTIVGVYDKKPLARAHFHAHKNDPEEIIKAIKMAFASRSADKK